MKNIALAMTPWYFRRLLILTVFLAPVVFHHEASGQAPADQKAVTQTSTGDQSPNIVTKGDVTITYGISEEKFEALAGELMVTKLALKSFFKILEQQQVPLEDLDSILREIAKHYKELLQRLEIIPSDDPIVQEFKTQARHAIEQSEFDQAEYKAMGVYEQALLFFNQAEKIFVEKLGEEHPYTKIVRDNITQLKDHL